jgi:type I restriction enzyme S subunit
VKELTWADLGQQFDGPHATPKRKTDGPYFLNISSLENGRLDLSKSDRLSEDEFVTWTRRVIPQSGDLLYSYETRLGEAALMPDGIKACLGRRMALLRPNPEVVDPKFLLYFYLGPQFQRTIQKHTITGATVPRLLLSEMPSWTVVIPPLEEQRGIAEVLGALDDKIAANSTLVAIGEDLAGALVRDALGVGSQSLGSIAAITMGSSPPGTSYNEVGKGMVFYQGVRDFGVRSPSNRVWTTEPVRTAEAGDTLVSVRAPVGRTNVATETTCLGRGLAGLRSDSPSTIYHLLRSVPEVWAPYEAEGTVFGSINKTQLDTLPVPVVEPSHASALEVRLSAIDRRVTTALDESAMLAATRDALLPLLMSGKVKVKDAESVVGDVI